MIYPPDTSLVDTGKAEAAFKLIDMAIQNGEKILLFSQVR
jgi:hypothetical protein